MSDRFSHQIETKRKTQIATPPAVMLYKIPREEGSVEVSDLSATFHCVVGSIKW
jgi:hypothetical protein